MQSNLTNLISTAVKKAIRRKHTLPNYKLRFKPFFKRLIFDEIDLPMEYSGTLELTLINLTRLNFPPQLRQVYATITLSSHSWIDAQQLNNENLVITMDVEIHKAKNQQIGIVFKQTERVIIESILPNTPAMLSDLKSDDVLVSIEGKKVNHLSQVAKILKNMTKSVLILRIERIIKGNIKNDAIGEDAADVYEDMNSSMNITFSKKSDTVSIGNENKINEPQHSRDSSAKNTPKSSPKKIVVTTFPQHSTIDCSLTDFIRMNDTTTFNLNPSFKYLNVNIYGRSTSDDNTLLGYLNVPLENVLAECNESNLEYIEKFMLNPPEFTEFTNTTLSQMSGFCSNICFGDISINFKWTQNTSGNRRDTLTHKSSLHGSQEDEGDEPKKHNFIRTSFTRSTQCDFCGKKIWLKDAVQCKDCQMCCHKKCMVRSQVSTICYGSIEQSEFLQLKVTDVDCQDDEDDESIESFKNSGSGHRQSFSDLLSSGIKRVNSANSLNIPTIVSNLSSSNSKSLPPTPQHSSRKPSLTNQNVNPFVIIIQRLEQMQGDKTTMTQDEIQRITGPIENDDLDDLMELAKSSSEQLYIEYDMEERVTKINDLVSDLNLFMFVFIN
jgi:PDZ domain-containing protein 8